MSEIIYENDDDRLICALYLENISQKDIGEKFDMSETKVRRILAKYGVKRKTIKQSVAEMIAAGCTNNQEMADRLQVDEKTIYRARHQLSQDEKPKSPIDLETVKAINLLRQDGMTVSDACASVGVTVGYYQHHKQRSEFFILSEQKKPL